MSGKPEHQYATKHFRVVESRVLCRDALVIGRYSILSRHVNFFALDLAETEVGDWFLIELNDGQAAVPSEHNLDELYGNLRVAVDS